MRTIQEYHRNNIGKIIGTDRNTIGNVIGIHINDKFIKDNSIDIILNCSSTFGFTELSVHKIRLPFSDSFEKDTDIELLRSNKKKICNFIKQNILEKNILICCYDGKTISPLLCALYNMHQYVQRRIQLIMSPIDYEPN